MIDLKKMENIFKNNESDSCRTDNIKSVSEQVDENIKDGNVELNNKAQRIIDICEKYLEAHKDNCSGFVKAVANELNIILSGQANDIVNQIQKHPWKLLANGIEADKKASEGKLVIAGLVDKPNGHVVVVVKRKEGDKLNRNKYPYIYCGSIIGKPLKYKTINWSWLEKDRDSVIYCYLDI